MKKLILIALFFCVMVNANEKEISTMKVKLNDKIFSATLEQNEAVNAFTQMMKKAPVVIKMCDYAGFEKVGSLGRNLPTSNTHITTKIGDIVLYNDNQIVIFYGSNSWDYTKIGHIDEVNNLKETLGNGDVEASFWLE
ncbi:hypothetical protein FMM54_00785 [Campylobacter sp. LR185c]|uniref:cyclophilin-like fold protein n=2 Tax=unclassified Campylobacter TaxID=2593542 RepID=UPI001237F519|nr:MULTISPECIES: cyclophilin-like fold protein [unclassified Campylobacter]KAA6228425.1 hypothetical protein FMM54_00785 [Campylobacter sp. LR185c]KAA6229398.1 hypothetical protein FMM57_00795 [Campylobacter sp. LR286c]KAA8603725.1 hypothetical protein CGP82_05950 [Campylobacter sp. LR185c]